MALRACPACDLLHEVPPLAAGQAARCRRCGELIASHKTGAVDRILAAAFATLALMGVAAVTPFLGVRRLGLGQDIALIDAAEALAAGGLAPMALFLVGAVLILPASRALADLYALLPPRLGFAPAPHAALALRMSGRARQWAMAEVFMIGVAVSLVKLHDMAAIVLGPAFWALAAAVVVLGFERASYCRDSAWALVAPAAPAPALAAQNRTGAALKAGLVACRDCGAVQPAAKTRCGRCGARLAAPDRRSLQWVWALWLTGLVAYVPANLYPMLYTTQFGARSGATILGGVRDLAAHGAWFVAVVVFVASIVIPIAKFIAVAVIASSIRHGAARRPGARLKLYHMVELIGRWSMIDVFVVAVLAALIQLGFIASIEAGPAAGPFALSVALTMLAANRLDPRLIWKE